MGGLTLMAIIISTFLGSQLYWITQSHRSVIENEKYRIESVKVHYAALSGFAFASQHMNDLPETTLSSKPILYANAPLGYRVLLDTATLYLFKNTDSVISIAIGKNGGREIVKMTYQLNQEKVRFSRLERL